MWQDVFRALVSWFPLSNRARQCPQILTTTVNPLVVPASSNLGGMVTGIIELPGDVDLEFDDWVFSSSNVGYPNTSGVRCSVYYGNREWGLFNTGILLEGIFGTGQRPGRIGYRPWRVETYGNRGILTFDLVNQVNVTCTVELYLRGHRRSISQGG